MATPNVVPRANCEGNIGTSLKKWTKMYTCTGFQIGADNAAGTFHMSNANNGSLIWEGQTADAYETIFYAEDHHGSNNADITYILDGAQGWAPYNTRYLQWTTNTSGMPKEWFTVCLSDETTPITTGTKLTWYCPYEINVTNIVATLTTVGSGGGVTTINIKEDDSGSMTSIYTTKLTIDAGEETRITAAAPQAFNMASPYGMNWADTNKIEFIVDTVTGGAVECGLKLNVYYERQHQ